MTDPRAAIVTPPSPEHDRYKFLIPLLTFLCLSVIVGVTAALMTRQRLDAELLVMERLATEKSDRIAANLEQHFSRGIALARMIEAHGGLFDNVNELGHILADHDAILSLGIAPGGVISHVFSQIERPELIGIDLFTETVYVGHLDHYESTALSQIVYNTRRFTMGGPFFDLFESASLIGRHPVFVSDATGAATFWGFVSVTLRYPQAIFDEDIYTDIQAMGFNYEMWRINPVSELRQTIGGQPTVLSSGTRHVDMPFSVLSNEWHLTISASTQWFHLLEVWLMIIVSFLLSLLGSIFIFFYQQERKRSEQLLNLSIKDPLTQIYNRRYFMECIATISQDFRKQGRVAYVLMFDLDHFKRVNDTYGHLAGDQVLIEMAALVNALLRPSDLFARYGGEEFITFLATADEADALQIAERIRTAIESTPVITPDHTIHITTSLGLAELTPTCSPKETINLADQRLYRAKRQGRNRLCYTDDDRAQDDVSTT